jgi:gluconolactonase
MTPDGQETTYATAPGGKTFTCLNYPAFDSQGNLYLTDSGDWTDEVNGYIYKVAAGGGEARLWYKEPVHTPNAIALDAEERHLYFVETFRSSICRIEIRKDGAAGALERLIHLPYQVPDGFAFDEEGRLWIAFHRPDTIKVLDVRTRLIETFAEDWKGNHLRSPTDAAFAGPNCGILLAGTLGNLCVHRFDNVGTRGLRLQHPKI